MPFIDPLLARAAAILKPEVPISSLFVTVDRAGQTRIREIESLGAFPTYSGKFLPQIHADVPASVLPALTRSGVVREAWYDAPHYAFAAPKNPLRSSPAEIQARLDERARRVGPTHLPTDPGGGSHLRSYLGAMGPLSVPHDSLTIGLDDVRKHVRADEANARGATGKGVLVAVIDTGVDGTHPMLDGKVRKHLSMVQEEPGLDGNGHGCVTPDSFVITTLCGAESIEAAFHEAEVNFGSKPNVMGGLNGWTVILPRGHKTVGFRDGVSLPTTLRAIHKIRYRGPIVKIRCGSRKYPNGHTFKLTPWHPLLIQGDMCNPQRLKWQYKKASEVQPREFLTLSSQVELDGEVEDPRKMYLLGYVVGDGHLPRSNSHRRGCKYALLSQAKFLVPLLKACGFGMHVRKNGDVEVYRWTKSERKRIMGTTRRLVLELLAKGFTRTQVAQATHRSFNTVRMQAKKLEEMGFLKIEGRVGRRQYYSPTEDGLAALRQEERDPPQGLWEFAALHGVPVGEKSLTVPLPRVACWGENLWPFLAGYIDADGSYDRERSRLRMRTSSYRLARQLCIVLNSRGICAKVDEQTDYRVRRIANGKPTKSRAPSWCIKVSRGNLRKLWAKIEPHARLRRPRVMPRDGGKLQTLEVLNTSIEEYDGFLYDLTTESENYLAGTTAAAFFHNTWCASCVAGNDVEYQGKVEQLRGRVLMGMAPEAEIIDVKVLTSEGAGLTSGVIQGIEAAVEEGADILSMSLGSLLGQAGLGPDAQAVNEAVRRGKIVLAAAGNAFGYGTVGSPASAAGAVAVASVAHATPVHDASSTFSSKGPLSNGKIKPDIAGVGGQLAPGGGPGNEVILGATSGVMATESGENWALLRGSSMSTPSVAGILATALPFGFPKERGAIEAIMARSAASRLGLFPIKNNRVGWGVLDAVSVLDALKSPPRLPVRGLISAQAARKRPLAGFLASRLSRLTVRDASTPQEFRLALT